MESAGNIIGNIRSNTERRVDRDPGVLVGVGVQVAVRVHGLDTAGMSEAYLQDLGVHALVDK
jgi:hypothetical protein